MVRKRFGGVFMNKTNKCFHCSQLTNAKGNGYDKLSTTGKDLNGSSKSVSQIMVFYRICLPSLFKTCSGKDFHEEKFSFLE